MNAAQSKQLSIIEFLEAQNIHPEKIIREEYWYKSPYRDEKTPSFTVNRKKNVWMDFGTGEGGNLVDLAIRIFNENDLSGVLKKIEDLSFSFRQQPSRVQQEIESELSAKRVEIEYKLNCFEPKETVLNQIESDLNRFEPVLNTFKCKPLNNPALLDYLASRKVDGTIAGRYCREIYYQVNGKHYFAIGFKNDSGGYELRNKYFKNCIAPKDYTLIKNGQKLLSIFEGFFDFLSYQQLLKGIEYRKFIADVNSRDLLNKITPDSDFLILNSVVHLERATEIIKGYPSLHLLFDNDKTGQFCVANIRKLGIPLEDLSVYYSRFKDLNEFLIGDTRELKRGLKI